MMEVLSLEDDEYEGLFITQSDRIVNGSDGGGISGVVNEGNSNAATSLSQADADVPMYSDISDDDAFEIPSSQQQIPVER